MTTSTELSNGCLKELHAHCGVRGEAYGRTPTWECGCACHTDGRYDMLKADLDERVAVSLAQ